MYWEQMGFTEFKSFQKLGQDKTISPKLDGSLEFKSFQKLGQDKTTVANGGNGFQFKSFQKLGQDKTRRRLPEWAASAVLFFYLRNNSC